MAGVLQVGSHQEARRAGWGGSTPSPIGRTWRRTSASSTVEFWSSEPATTPEVSIEEDLQEDRGLSIGDVVSFDILGRTVAARVTSVRAVDWDDSRSGGFMFLFRPGSLDGAPHSYIAFMQGPTGREARARLQRDIVARYANVSVIDGLEVIRTIRRVLDYVTTAITVVGGVALFSGTLILIGSVAMTKFQRLYDSAVFKTLGANTRDPHHHAGAGVRGAGRPGRDGGLAGRA